MTRQISRRRLLGVTLTGAVLLTACSMDPGTTATSGPSSSQPAGQTSAAGTARAQPRGEFRVNLQGEPKTIDPNKANFSQETAIVTALFEGLLALDANLELVPAAAVEIPTSANGGISSDGLTYTYKLRDDLKWSDGKPVSSRDFEYGIKRTLDPRTASPYASFYYDIKGAEELNKALGTKDTPRQLSDGQIAELISQVAVSAPDDRTLMVQLKRPRFTFNQLMALWPAFPIRQDLVEAHGDSWIRPGTIIGNGPWKLTEWENQSKLVMVPNEHYRGEQPKLAKLIWLQIPDEVAAFAAYETDGIDLTPVPRAQLGLVPSDPRYADQLVRTNELATFSIQMNVTKPPFDNLKVRQAIATALDREAFVRDLQQGIGKPAYSWVPPGMPGHDPDAGKQYAFDPAKAKQLLAEAGYADGRGLPQITFTYADSGSNKSTGEWLQAQLKQNLGIDIRLDVLETKAYQSAYTQNQLQMFLAGWGADYPDPDNWLPDIFGTGRSGNHTELSDPQLDDLMAQALAEPDNAKRLQLWKDAQRRVLDLCPLVPLIYRERLWLKKPQFKGFQTTAKDQVPGNRFYHHVYVE